MSAEDNMRIWRDAIQVWYPEYKTKTYFVPPVVITRIPFEVKAVDAERVLVPKTTSDNSSKQVASTTPLSTSVGDEKNKHTTASVHDRKPSEMLLPVQDGYSRDDLALEQVLFAFRELALKNNEVMFVISQLNFSSYLGRKSYEGVVSHFLRPINLAKEFRQGDFDILLIHRLYGILAGEIKSVGLNREALKVSLEDELKNISKRVKQAVKQLNKSKKVLRKLTKDLDPKLPIRKILILPYVTTIGLQDVLTNDTELKQEFIQCLGRTDSFLPVDLCLLHDNLVLNDQWNLGQFGQWWSRCVSNTNGSLMSEKVYLDLLARFCGPATTIPVYCITSRLEVRTEGEGVAVLADRMTLLTLTPEQMSLLERAPANVMLTGGPGVGKSVMLGLIGTKWLRQGHDVHLVSVKPGCFAVTLILRQMMENALRKDSPPTSPVSCVRLHNYDFTKTIDVGTVARALKEAAKDKWLCVICDELYGHESAFIERYHQFVAELFRDHSKVRLWAASPYHNQIPPELQEEQMTIPLRCPPAVLGEVNEGVNHYDTVHNYSTKGLPSPCDGPRVIRVKHEFNESGHTGRWPVDCNECGKLVAGILKTLGVGQDGAHQFPEIATREIFSSKGEVTTLPQAPYLQYRDVFVLTRSNDLFDADPGSATSTPNGVVCGLRSAGIPVHVIRKGFESSDLQDIFLETFNSVTLVCCANILGLERKVVVWMPYRREDLDDKLTDDYLQAMARLGAMSRCTAQLIVVDVPLS